MSKHNKANKNNYVQSGRLTPDEMARERMKQGQVTGRATGKEHVIGQTRGTPGPGPTRPRSERAEEE